MLFKNIGYAIRSSGFIVHLLQAPAMLAFGKHLTSPTSVSLSVKSEL